MRKLSNYYPFKFGIMAAVVAALMVTLASAQETKEKPLLKSIPTDDVPQYLQDIGVTIRASGAEGSGVFKVTKDGQVWVWTCGHLVDHLRTVRKTDDGKTIVSFDDAKIIKVLTEGGRKVGELNFDAEVIRYSHAEYGEDLALLRLRSKQYKPSASVLFYLDEKIPSIGAKLLHCGSLLGQMGSNSVTSGIVSQHGRVLFNDVIFDQTNAASFPGSSGGVICLEKNGLYVGMLVRGAGETFSLYVPVRRMRAWAQRVGVEFAMNDDLAIPSNEELKKRQVDDSMRTPSTEAPKPHVHSRDFPTLLYMHNNPRSSVRATPSLFPNILGHK